jgi:hypothetical protein
MQNNAPLFFKIDSTEDHQRVLLLYMKESFWNIHVNLKLAKRYNLIIGYIERLLEDGTQGLIDQVKYMCEAYKIDFIIVHNEFSYLVSPYTIRELNKIKNTGILVFDHYLSSSTILCVREASLAMVACPLLAVQLTELGVESLFFPLEGNAIIDLYLNDKKVKNHDVLFYGSTNELRAPFIDRLRTMKGISVNLHEADINKNFLSYEQLYDLISKARIVINLSKFKPALSYSNSVLERNGEYVYGMKGRIQEAAFCGTLCISEFTPQLNLIGIESIVPQFTCPEHMVDMIYSKLDHDVLISSTKEFVGGINDIYSDEIIVKKLSKKINLLNEKNIHKNKVMISYYKKDLQVFEYFLRQKFSGNKERMDSEMNNLMSITKDDFRTVADLLPNGEINK